LIVDNSSAKTSQPSIEFRATHPQVHLRFIPTYARDSKKVELRFGTTERDIIARGVFTSVADVKRYLLRYMRNDNMAPTRKMRLFNRVTIAIRRPSK
jgi:hypothetical protein